MGGDGGTKAVNRTYLRGAGAASTTGDQKSQAAERCDKPTEEHEAQRAMRYCYISDQPLQFHNDDDNNSNDYHKNTVISAVTPQQSLLSTSNIVTCRYGRLYNKEAAIEALLQRKQMSKKAPTSNNERMNNGIQSRLGLHVRGLKDLYQVRFQTVRQNDETTKTAAAVVVVPVCPITGRELNGRIVAYALIPGHPDAAVNVVSEYALKQLSEPEILAEYGATKKIRLLAPPSLYETIDQDFAKQEALTSTNHKRKKLKHHDRKNERDTTLDETLERPTKKHT